MSNLEALLGKALKGIFSAFYGIHMDTADRKSFSLINQDNSCFKTAVSLQSRRLCLVPRSYQFCTAPRPLCIGLKRAIAAEGSMETIDPSAKVRQTEQINKSKRFYQCNQSTVDPCFPLWLYLLFRLSEIFKMPAKDPG